jgi:hypothetical protein
MAAMTPTVQATTVNPRLRAVATLVLRVRATASILRIDRPKEG